MRRAVVLVMLMFMVIVSLSAIDYRMEGKYVMIGSDKRPIRKEIVTVDEKGVCMTTGSSPARATGLNVVVDVAADSQVILTEREEGVIVYAVYGAVTVTTTEPEKMVLYTPVTKIEGMIDGEVFIRSTDDEEDTYNFSDASYTATDLIRGNVITINPECGYNYMKAKLIELPKGVGNSIRIPAMPVFLSVTETLVG